MWAGGSQSQVISKEGFAVLVPIKPSFGRTTTKMLRRVFAWHASTHSSFIKGDLIQAMCWSKHLARRGNLVGLFTKCTLAVLILINSRSQPLFGVCVSDPFSSRPPILFMTHSQNYFPCSLMNPKLLLQSTCSLKTSREHKKWERSKEMVIKEQWVDNWKEQEAKRTIVKEQGEWTPHSQKKML